MLAADAQIPEFDASPTANKFMARLAAKINLIPSASRPWYVVLSTLYCTEAIKTKY